MLDSKLVRTTALVVSATFLLTACATTSLPTDRPLTPQEQAMREQAKNYNETVAEGAVVGALLGGLLVAGLGGKPKDIVAGAAAGGAMGFVAGNYVADKKRQYASAEAQYNSMIGDVEAENARMAAFADASRQVIADDLKTLEAVDAQVAAGTLSQADAKRQLAVLDSNREVMTKTLAGLQKKQKEFEEVREAAKSLGNTQQQQRMDGEIEKMRIQITKLEAELGQLVSRRKVSRVG